MWVIIVSSATENLSQYALLRLNIGPRGYSKQKCRDLDYFLGELLTHGIYKTLEGQKREMLSRFPGGLLHTFIHVGYII